MRYYDNPVTEREKISNALLSFNEEDFDKLMLEIHQKWFDAGYEKGWENHRNRIDIIREAPFNITF